VQKSESEVSLETSEKKARKGIGSTGNRQWAFIAIGLTRQANKHGGGEVDGFSFLTFRVKRYALTKESEKQHDMSTVVAGDPQNFENQMDYSEKAYCGIWPSW
jgi:hypothetical protein